MYHLNPKGEPGLCKAENQCPFGDAVTAHYATEDEARSAYESRVQEVQTNLSEAKLKVEVQEAVLATLEAAHKVQVAKLAKGKKSDPGDPDAVDSAYKPIPAAVDELRSKVYRMLYWEKQAVQLGLVEERTRPFLTDAAKRADKDYKDTLRAKAVFKKPMAVGPYRQLIGELTAWSGLSREEVKSLLRSYDEKSGMSRDEYMVHLFQTHIDTTRDRVFVDLETTSLHPTSGEIIEIGIVRVSPDGEVKATVDERFNMEDEYQRDEVGTGPDHVHKITADSIRDLPVFRSSEVQSRMAEHLNDPDVIIVAHNGTFEHAWFAHNLEGYYETHDPASSKILTGAVEAPRMQDTRTLAMLLGHDLPNTRLASFTEGNGVPYVDAHSAFPDAAMTWRAFDAFKQRVLAAPPGQRPKLETVETPVS